MERQLSTLKVPVVAVLLMVAGALWTPSLASAKTPPFDATGNVSCSAVGTVKFSRR